MDTTTNRAEAERLLGIAEKLLRKKDFAGCKEFAILAQDTEPLLDGSDQILTVAEVLIASERRIGQQNDWYSILQITHLTNDPDLIRKQYRRLALLLHPDKNKYPFADTAFHLVSEAWSVLSDSNKKSLFDKDFSLFTKIDLAAMKRHNDHQQQTNQDQNQGSASQKLPVRRSGRAAQATNVNLTNAGSSGAGSSKRNNLGNRGATGSQSGGATGGQSGERSYKSGTAAAFWTVCPYCYHLHEYPRTYEGCCLKCQNCERAFTGMEISSVPPTVPGKEAYYCCWGFFPMGFVNGKYGGGGVNENTAGNGFPNWMPPMFSGNPENTTSFGGAMEMEQGNVTPSAPANGAGGPVQQGSVKPGAKKRGRPRKNPF